MQFNPRDESSIKAVMAKANVVINLIGTFLWLFIFLSLVDVNFMEFLLPVKLSFARKGV